MPPRMHQLRVRRPNTAEVRFFNDEDKEQAEKLVDFLKVRLKDNNLEARYYDDKRASLYKALLRIGILGYARSFRLRTRRSGVESLRARHSSSFEFLRCYLAATRID